MQLLGFNLAHMNYSISADRVITCEEFSDLLGSVGWGDAEEAAFLRSRNSYLLIVTARSSDGLLVGYASAFSDGAFTTMLGELIVRPGSQPQRLGIGRSLIRGWKASSQAYRSTSKRWATLGTSSKPAAIGIFRSA